MIHIKFKGQRKTKVCKSFCSFKNAHQKTQRGTKIPGTKAPGSGPLHPGRSHSVMGVEIRRATGDQIFICFAIGATAGKKLRRFTTYTAGPDGSYKQPAEIQGHCARVPSGAPCGRTAELPSLMSRSFYPATGHFPSQRTHRRRLIKNTKS